MKKYSEYAPIVLLAMFTTKLLVLNVWSFESAIVLVGLAGLCAVFQIKAKNDEIQKINETLEKVTKELETLKTSDEHIRSSIATIKMAQGLKPAAMKF